ncbi:MAG: S8 family serine peptidase [Chloroflexota bacterium]|nr:S8 family serine peptidase [Chloroflexota bacterium]
MIARSAQCLLSVWVAVTGFATGAPAVAVLGSPDQRSGVAAPNNDDRRERRAERKNDRQRADGKKDDRRAKSTKDGRDGKNERDKAADEDRDRLQERRESRQDDPRLSALDEDDADDADGFDDDDGFPPLIDDDDDATTDGFRAQQAIVRLKPGTNIDNYADRHDADVAAAIPAQNLYLLDLPGAVTDPVRLGPLRNDARTVWVELNYGHQAPEGRPGRFFLSATPVSPQDAAAAEPPAALGIADAWSCATGDGAVVAVLDTGFDAAHPELAGRIVAGGRNVLANRPNTSDVGNGIDDDGDGLVDEMTGHGTHVAGIIAQVAPDAGLLPIKVLDSDGVGDAFYVAAGIYRAIDRGAEVINLSLGSTHDALVIAEAVRAAHDAGIVVFAAAGNADRDLPPEYPATDRHAFGVAATDANDVKSGYSNYHARLLLSAPGNDVISAFPGGGYAAWSGTSMATPWVAGAAALLLEMNPNRTVNQVGTRLAATADPIPNHDPRYDGLLGAGRLDVGAATACSD